MEDQAVTAEARVESGAKPPVKAEYMDHVRKVNDVFYDQIVISDQKAAYIFTFMLAFLVTSSEGREVFTWARYANGTLHGVFFSALLALSSLVSMLAAIMVVLPQHVKKSTSLFWGTWNQHRVMLEEAAHRCDQDYLFRQYLDNADVLSLIARRKYRFVTYAFRALMVTVIAYVLLLVSN
ncbi:Pycsar system effector family protein [Gellertiella hungarica]|uniref:Pycsar effector protein domain-containing protein n=1 Tax=Gellertiella hungarica TaxID=1572859 RepID=A0A7W6NJ34_9HYPH|nr:hypothetical protein [Gellertiella hungarica]